MTRNLAICGLHIKAAPSRRVLRTPKDGGAVGYSVSLACGRLSARIQAATDISLKNR